MGIETTGRDKLNQQDPKSFSEFWVFYVGEHLHPLTRFVHTTGTTLALILLVAVFLSKAWIGLLFVPIVGYGFAWFSHFLIEKNRPATFRHPIWSLLSDFVMLYKTFNNTMEAEVIKVKKLKGLASFLVLIFCASFFVNGSAGAETEIDETAFKKTAKGRYEDFYDRKKRLEELAVEKNRGVKAQQQERNEEAMKAERSRQEQVELRKKVVDTMTPLEAAHLQEEKEKKKEQLEKEREFSKRMDLLRKFRKSHYQIPENEEYELDQ